MSNAQKPEKNPEKPPVKVAIQCPDCNKSATISEYIKTIPQFGKILISTLKCEHCGFKFNDVMNAEFHGPKKYTAEIKKPADLHTKIIRSSSATIKMPKLGIKIEPGPASEGYFTNIEGLLDRTESALKALGADNPAVKKELKLIARAKNAELKFTIEVSDPFGNSGLVGGNVTEKAMSEKEADRLKTGMGIFELKKKEGKPNKIM